MNFIFKPTLEHIALMKLVSALWNQHDIRALLEEFSNTAIFLQVDDYLTFQRLVGQERWTGEKEEKWQTIETSVIEKIPQHIMQTSLKDKIIGYIKPVGLQVLRWLEYHRKCFCLNLKLPGEFCWTLQGIIDKKKTAEVLIKNEDININIRYKLACIYCLEHDIPELWNKIPESLKVISPNMTDYISDPREVSKNALLKFWEHFKKGNVHWENKILINRRAPPLQGAYLLSFLSAASMANKAATEYFLPRTHQRQVFLVRAAIFIIKMHNKIHSTISDPPKEYFAEVLCFLLSQMNDMQQLRIFQRSPTMLFPLLQWPWQTLFVEVVTHICRIIPENVQILKAVATGIVRKVKLGYKDYNYRKMYELIWQQLPNDYRNHNINNGSLASIVALLLEIKDSKNIKLMFQHISITERNELISSNTAFNTCSTIAEYEEWDLLKLFVQQCVTSKDEMIKFKEKVMEHVTRESLRDKWDKFSQVLDDLVCGFEKRKSVDEGECTSSTAKRLCKSDNMCE